MTYPIHMTLKLTQEMYKMRNGVVLKHKFVPYDNFEFEVCLVYMLHKCSFDVVYI